MSRPEPDRRFERLLEYLKRSRGFDFTGYKRATLLRRVHARMAAVGIADLDEYRDHLEVHPDEFTHLFNTVLINVTSFFRDPDSWETLMGDVIPRIAAARTPDQPIRVWSAGCASGEEAYTLVMAFAEVLGLERFREQVKVYATDMDEEALAHARSATYSAKALDPLPTELRDRYFEPAAGDRRVFRPDLRRQVIFGRHDLMQDAPISHLDLLVCRNTLMYFNAETQARILGRLHFGLRGDGVLFLGRAEMLLSHGRLFTPLNLKTRLFTKVPRVNMRDRLTDLAHHRDAGAPHMEDGIRLRDAALDAEPAAQIVIDAHGRLALANAAARDLFRIAPGELGRPVQDLQLSYRPVDLRTALDEVRNERRIVTLPAVEWHAGAGDSRVLDMQMIPLPGVDDRLMGVSVTFSDVTRFHRLKTQLQVANQGMETAYEELETTIEELETTNEELQSTNEEMETMNEELQATNDELETLNDELRRRTEDLNTVNAYLESILGSLRMAVVVVARDGRVHLWNPPAENFWGLRAEEVAGQNLFALDIGLPLGELRRVVDDCMQGKKVGSAVVLTAINRCGRPMRCRVSCAPLLGSERDIQGVVLLMEDAGDSAEPPGERLADGPFRAQR